MTRRLLAVIPPVLLLTLTGPAALAAWTSVGGATGSVTATSVNIGNAPAPVRVVTSSTDGSVDLSWSASTLASGDPVGHYDVVRSDGTTSTTVCAATTTTCTDATPVAGPVTYAVVPRIGAYWTGLSSNATAFQFDEFAPATTVERTPVASASGWDNDAVHVTLTATDPAPVASGVKEIHYTINGGPEVVVPGGTAEFDVTEQDQYAIAFWAVDNLGNAESPAGTEDVNIDLTAPVSTGTLSGDQVTLSATDAGGSGLAYIEYRVGSSGEYSLYGDVPVTLSDGETIYFRAVDVAGNVETPESSVTYTAPVTDSQAPSTSVASSPVPNAAGWTTADTTLTLTSTDNVGVTKLEWRVGPSGTVTTVTGAGPYTLGPFATVGTTNVQYRALDAAGNAEAWTSYDVKIDKTAPAGAFVHPTGNHNDSQYRNGCGTTGSAAAIYDFCGTASDLAGSGIAKVEFEVRRTSTSPENCLTAAGAGTLGTCGSRLVAEVTGQNWIAKTGIIPGATTYRLTVWITDVAGHETEIVRGFTKTS